MFKDEKEALKRATKKLERLMGDNLLTVLAFGSRVRGDFSGDSDFDVLVVVRKRTFQIIDEVNGAFYAEEEKTGIPFSVIVKTEGAFEKERKHDTAFYRNMKEEGFLLYGAA